MKILVISHDLKRPIRLVFPTSLIKRKFVWNMILKHQKNIDFDYKLAYETIKKAYKPLRRFIKVNGHFNLVEVIDKSGEIVRIRV